MLPTVRPMTAAQLPSDHLGIRERQILLELIESHGKVLSREELALRIGIGNLSIRRCDSAIATLRRHLPSGAITTVRKRGWFLDQKALHSARTILTTQKH